MAKFVEAPNSSTSSTITLDFSIFDGLLTLEAVIIVTVALFVISGLFRKRRRRRTGWHPDGEGGWEFELGDCDSDSGNGD